MICKIAFKYQGVLYLPGQHFDFETLDVEDRNEAFTRKHFQPEVEVENVVTPGVADPESPVIENVVKIPSKKKKSKEI